MFLQQTAQPAQQPGGIVAFLPLIFILAIFYLIVFLPARRRQKKLQDMIDTLKAGDKVALTGTTTDGVVRPQWQRPSRLRN